MTKQLTSKEIDILYSFVQKKGVKYVDLQYELVDHLASEIEELMAQNSEMSFDDSLSFAYSRFPITGFSNILTEKERAMRSYWRNKTYEFIKRFFELPRIIISVVLFLTSYYLLFNEEKGHIIMPVIGLFLCVVSLDELIRNSIRAKKNRLLVQKMYNDRVLLFGVILGLSSRTLIDIFPPFQSAISAIIYAFINTLVVLWLYGTWKVFPKMIEDEVNIKYKHIKPRKIYS